MVTFKNLNPEYRDSKKTTAMKWLAAVRLRNGIVGPENAPEYSDPLVLTYKKILSVLTGVPIRA